MPARSPVFSYNPKTSRTGHRSTHHGKAPFRSAPIKKKSSWCSKNRQEDTFDSRSKTPSKPLQRRRQGKHLRVELGINERQPDATANSPRTSGNRSLPAPSDEQHAAVCLSPADGSGLDNAAITSRRPLWNGHHRRLPWPVFYHDHTSPICASLWIPWDARPKEIQGLRQSKARHGPLHLWHDRGRHRHRLAAALPILRVERSLYGCLVAPPTWLKSFENLALRQPARASVRILYLTHPYKSLRVASLHSPSTRRRMPNGFASFKASGSNSSGTF